MVLNRRKRKCVQKTIPVGVCKTSAGASNKSYGVKRNDTRLVGGRRTKDKSFDRDASDDTNEPVRGSEEDTVLDRFQERRRNEDRESDDIENRFEQHSDLGLETYKESCSQCEEYEGEVRRLKSVINEQKERLVREERLVNQLTRNVESITQELKMMNSKNAALQSRLDAAEEVVKSPPKRKKL